MIEKSEAMQMLEKVLEASVADQTEVVLTEGESALTRFANNVIHQNVAYHDAHVAVRVAKGNRVGVAGTNRLDDVGLGAVAERALAIAKVTGESPDFESLPMPAPLRSAEAFDPRTVECTPDVRADAVARMVKQARTADATAAGAFSTSGSAVAVANSLGVRAYHPITEASLNLTMTRQGGNARATDYGWKLAEVDPDAAAQAAASRVIAAADPVDVEPGPWTVILEHDAVSTLVQFLSHLGFGAKACQEKRSFVAGKLGLKITGDQITIWDDGLDPMGVPFPFDFEGMPKKKVMLIENGIAKGVVYDSRTAAKEGKTSTGHALPPQFSFGPMAWNLFMAGGDSSIDRMIASTKKGLLVSAFHYVNVAEPMKTVLTGMTRFGTFLVEDGVVKRAVKNLRFTQSVLDAFDRVAAVSADRKRFDGAVVPAVKIEQFHFTGKTEF